MPTAVTLNSTVSPSTADNDPLTPVITGGDSTLKLTVSLVSVPAWLLTTTWYSPLLVASTLAKLRLLPSAPSTAWPPTYH